MRRIAHHRCAFRVGPHHSWVQRKAYHLSKIFRHVHASWRLARELRRLRPGEYAIVPATLALWLQTLDDAYVYASDETGDVWQ